MHVLIGVGLLEVSRPHGHLLEVYVLMQAFVRRCFFEKLFLRNDSFPRTFLKNKHVYHVFGSVPAATTCTNLSLAAG